MGTNTHDWYGFISSYNNKLNKNFSLTAGLDGRYYKGFHYDKITDLLGGEYYLDTNLAWRDPASKLSVGDKISFDYFSEVLWLGAFAQMEYTKGNYNAFASITVSDNMYQRTDPGKYGKFSNQTTYPESDKVTEWQSFLPISAKAGLNVKFGEMSRVYVNGGYVTRTPSFENVYSDNTPIANPIKEKIVSTEIGYGLKTSSLDILISAYYTKWMDKSVTKAIGSSWTGPKACIPDIDALHKGFEVEISYSPAKWVNLDGFVSVGDWKWTNDITYSHYDENKELVGTFSAYTKDLHVGNVPQTSAFLSASFVIFDKINIGFDANYYGKFYADFSPDARTNADDRSESWKMPSYKTVDINASYVQKISNGMSLQWFANINNLFNEEYISDGTDGTSHDEASAVVWYGFGTTWTAGLRINF